MGRFSKLETGGKGDHETPRAGVRTRQRADDPGQVYDHAYYVGEADRLFYGGEYEKALRLYSRAIQADSTRIEPWIGQVLCLIELKQLKEALIWVRRGLELYPEEPRMISVQGAAYAHQGMMQRAIGCSDYAMQKTGADPLVWVLRAQVLTLAENGNAQFCFDKAMETRTKGDWRVPLAIGRFLMARKRWAQAAEFLKTAAADNTRSDHLWAMLGETNENLGLTQNAVEAYKAALELNPANADANDGMSRLTQTPLLVRIFRRLAGR
jgi:tetratricopeptide (TPR) repeat protein